MPDLPRKVRFNNKGTQYIGTYRIEGRFLSVTCAYGTQRALIGLLKEKRLAQALLRALVLKADKDIVSTVPAAAVIDLVKEAAPHLDAPVPPLPLSAIG